jgi:hypothetical protein
MKEPRLRKLIVTADDFGIGPETSRGILDLALAGRVSAAVLLVNSPHAAAAVAAWRRSGMPMELGWHPCLTLDRPLLFAARVPTLVQADGSFPRLGGFLRRLILEKIDRTQVAAELAAQYQRFCDLAGQPPVVVNAHHHIHVFPTIGRVLLDMLRHQQPRPVIRKVCEPLRVLVEVPGARLKRLFLSTFGRRMAALQDRLGFPGNDGLAGLADPENVEDPAFFVRWLTTIPGDVVELTCHPGGWDATLVGRDGTAGDGLIRRRVRELELLADPSFPAAIHQAGFTLIPPSQLAYSRAGRTCHAA